MLLAKASFWIIQHQSAHAPLGVLTPHHTESTYAMTTPSSRLCHSSLFQMPKNIIGLNNEKLISVDDKLFRVVFGGTTFPP